MSMPTPLLKMFPVSHTTSASTTKVRVLCGYLREVMSTEASPSQRAPSGELTPFTRHLLKLNYCIADRAAAHGHTTQRRTQKIMGCQHTYTTEAA